MRQRLDSLGRGATPCHPHICQMSVGPASWVPLALEGCMWLLGAPPARPALAGDWLCGISPAVPQRLPPPRPPMAPGPPPLQCPHRAQSPAAHGRPCSLNLSSDGGPRAKVLQSHPLLSSQVGVSEPHCLQSLSRGLGGRPGAVIADLPGTSRLVAGRAARRGLTWQGSLWASPWVHTGPRGTAGLPTHLQPP